MNVRSSAESRRASGGGLATLWRALFRAVLALGFIVGATIMALYLVAMQSLPRIDGTLRFVQLDARVEIVRDAHGIAHIFAKTRHDGFFALGYVHATDRLWQMDLSRRLAQGRLSERFGKQAVPTDRLMRALDLDGHARRSLAALDQETRTILSTYASGVNARIAEVRERDFDGGAPEFLIFGKAVEDWKPEDSLSVLKSMAFQISQTALNREVKRGHFLLTLRQDQVRDLFPEYPGQGVMALPRAAIEDGGEQKTATTLFPFDFSDPRLGGGSNAWAVDGKLSASRAPLLANDPHLPLTAPTIWYPVQLSAPGFEVIGAGLAGVPAIATGRNRKIAWGVTAAQIDDLDIFIEQLDPDDPDLAMVDGVFEPLESRNETIGVRGAPDIALRLQRSRHGPILPNDIAGLYAVTPRNHAPAIAWTALSDDDTSLEALLALNRADSAAAALRAGEQFVAPAVNLVVADAQRIGMALAGRVPLRRLTSRFQGRVPAPGWTDAHDWIGWMSPNALPKVINPASGMVANANNRIGEDAFPRHLSFDWAPPYRIDRIEKLLQARETHSLQGFEAMQSDSVSEMARTVAPLIGAAIWESGEDRGAHWLRRDALERLRSWNGDMSEHDPEPLIFNAWLDALTVRLVADELGELADSYRGPRPLFLERVFRDIDGAGVWCDDIGTDLPESCAEMAAAALDEALRELVREHGSRLDRWRWGAVHRAEHRHPALGHLDFSLFGIGVSLSRLFNIEMETSGGDYTLNRGASTHIGATPYASIHGAGYRGVYDLADLDRSRFIVATGTSGHFLSPLYDNLAPLWRAGELVPMSMARNDIEPGALGTLTLEPAQTGASPILP